MGIGQQGINVAITQRKECVFEAFGQRHDLPLPVPAPEVDNLPGPAYEPDAMESWIEPTRMPLIRDELEFLQKFSRLLRPHVFPAAAPAEPQEGLRQVIPSDEQ